MQDAQKEMIKYVLTLRYYPQRQTTYPTFTSADLANGIPSTIFSVPMDVYNHISSNLSILVNKFNLQKACIAISGGLDSFITLATFRKLFPYVKVHCISGGFSEDDPDLKKGEEIARLFNCQHHKVLLNDFIRQLPLGISIVGEPRHNLYWHFIAKEASKHSKFLISGDGADELYGGYVFRYRKILELIQENNSWEQKAQAYLNCHERDWVEDQEDMFGAKINFGWHFILDYLRRFFDNKLDILSQCLFADYHGKLLNDWIPSHRKQCGFFGVQGFSPFLEPETIRYAMKIPLTWKYDPKNNLGKLVLRNICRRFYKTQYEKLGKQKVGFGPDQRLIWRQNNDMVLHYLSDARICKDGLISMDWITKAIARANNDQLRYIAKLFSVLSLEVWYRIFVTKEMDETVTL